MTEPASDTVLDRLLASHRARAAPLDSAETKPVVRIVCARYGYACPEICTPGGLMGGREDGG